MGRPHAVRLVIPGALPTLNEYIRSERGNRYSAANLKKQTQDRIKLVLWAQARRLHYDRPVDIKFVWTVKDRRKDKDNIAFAKKFVLDALVEMDVLNDDGWNDINTLTDEFRIGEEKTEIYIY